MNILDEITERVCKDEYPRFADRTCPYSGDKDHCDTVSIARREKEEMDEAFMRCLKFTCDVFQSWEGEGAYEWLQDFLMPWTKDPRMGNFLSYFFQTAYQMGQPHMACNDQGKE